MLRLDRASESYSSCNTTNSRGMYEEAFLKVNDCLIMWIEYWYLFFRPIASLQILIDVLNLSQPCKDGSFQTGSKNGSITSKFQAEYQQQWGSIKLKRRVIGPIAPIESPKKTWNLLAATAVKWLRANKSGVRPSIYPCVHPQNDRGPPLENLREEASWPGCPRR